MRGRTRVSRAGLPPTRDARGTSGNRDLRPALAAGRVGASGTALLPYDCCFYFLPFPLQSQLPAVRGLLCRQAGRGDHPAAGSWHYALVAAVGRLWGWAPRQPALRAPLQGSEPDPVDPRDAPEGFGAALLMRVPKSPWSGWIRSGSKF